MIKVVSSPKVHVANNKGLTFPRLQLAPAFKGLEPHNVTPVISALQLCRCTLARWHAAALPLPLLCRCSAWTLSAEIEIEIGVLSQPFPALADSYRAGCPAIQPCLACEVPERREAKH